MPKYLFEARYAAEGAQGLASEGGTARRAAVTKMIEGSGGKLESFHFAFGDVDAFVIVELPDAVTAAAAAVTINKSGEVTVRTVPLLTPEEMDAACKKSVSYRPPGS